MADQFLEVDLFPLQGLKLEQLGAEPHLAMLQMMSTDQDEKSVVFSFAVSAAQLEQLASEFSRVARLMPR